jgi:hypothetical protein
MVRSTFGQRINCNGGQDLSNFRGGFAQAGTGVMRIRNFLAPALLPNAEAKRKAAIAEQRRAGARLRAPRKRWEEQAEVLERFPPRRPPYWLNCAMR